MTLAPGVPVEVPFDFPLEPVQAPTRSTTSSTSEARRRVGFMGRGIIRERIPKGPALTDLSHPATAFGLGVALGAAPGPVQLLLLSEASRGGFRRGFRAMAGANGTFGLYVFLLAAGLSAIAPGPAFLRVVKVVGGGFLVFLAYDAYRESRRTETSEGPRAGMPPLARAILAVVFNPAVYVFLATTGAALVADAVHAGGRALAFLTVAAMLAGVASIDAGMVLLAGGGVRRMNAKALRLLGDVLAIGLGALGAWLVIRGIAG